MSPTHHAHDYIMATFHIQKFEFDFPSHRPAISHGFKG